MTEPTTEELAAKLEADFDQEYRRQPHTWMGITDEANLRRKQAAARLRELEAENAELKHDLGGYADTTTELAEENARLLAQIKRMQSAALDELAALGQEIEHD